MDLLKYVSYGECCNLPDSENFNYFDESGMFVCAGTAFYSADVSGPNVPDIVWGGQARLLDSFVLWGIDGHEVDLMDFLEDRKTQVAVTNCRKTPFCFHHGLKLITVPKLKTLVDVAFLLHEFGHASWRAHGINVPYVCGKFVDSAERYKEERKRKKIAERDATCRALLNMREIKRKTGINLFSTTVLECEDKFSYMEGRADVGQGIITDVRLALKEAYGTYNFD